MRYLFTGLIVFFAITQGHSTDIPSPNTGEKAMIQSLRHMIDQDPSLKKAKIILGAGTSGSQAFKKPAPFGTLHLLLTEQWLDTMNDLAKGTVVVAPEHAIDNNFSLIETDVKIIKIKGVLHTKTMENIQDEDTTALLEIAPQMIVMLGEDTEQPSGDWKQYTKEMVSEMLEELPTDQKILFLNGPSTGKYKLIGSTLVPDETAHRTTTDTITQFVLAHAVQKPWKVIDFKYGEKSLWGPSLKYCIQNPMVTLVLPGNSTSMISEALTLGIKPALVMHDAMSPTSVKYVKDLVAEGKATLFPDLPKDHEKRQVPVPPQEIKILQELGRIVKS